MHRLLLALILGWAGQETPPAPAPTAQPVEPAIVALAQKIAQQPAPTAEEIRASRGAVRHIAATSSNGRVLHRFAFPDGDVIEFSDRPRGARQQANRERVVAYGGEHSAARESDATFEAAGKTFNLSPDVIRALRYISRHEGGFDAINTWDRARFSWGFIQFAGGYGLRPMLAHLKANSPDAFRRLLGLYGVDVQPGADGRPEPIYLDGSRILRGDDAEQAFGDDPLLIACFIRAGRMPEVKQRQVEAAIRNYVMPALTATWEGATLANVFHSPRGLAFLIDRQVHEGNTGRLGWSLEHARLVRGIPDPTQWPALEGEAMNLAVQDSSARSEIAALVEKAAGILDKAAKADDPRFASGLAEVREALTKGRWLADYRMVVGYRRDELGFGCDLTQMLIAPDALSLLTPADAASRLTERAGSLRELISRLRFEFAVRNRLADIRGCELPGP
jgi:peptidoglycan endopeptidase LytF